MGTKRRLYRLSLWQLARTCLYIGVTGYGGPAIVGNMKQIFVDRKKWITEQEFLTGLSLSQMLPSATGVNTIEFLGYQVRGPLGAIVAPICFITPATVLITILSAIYFKYGTISVARELFTGLGAVVVALIINAIVALGKSAIKDRWAAGIALAGFAIIQFLHLTIPVVVLVSATAGYLIYRNKVTETSAEEANGSHRPRTPALFWVSFWGILAVLVVLVVLTYHTATARLFLSILRVGAMTFGGGFMSIPIFQHEAVSVHGWLTNREFLDGIALGQITPGPVLITACFIGYRVLGVFGALLGAATIFLPGVLGMFLLAHQHEKVSHLGWLKAIVRGIVAGFMGVLVSVIIRLGMQSLTGWKTICMAAAALVVLLVWKKDPLWVILGGAVVSLLVFR